MRDGSQFSGMLFHPRIDGGIPRDSAVESQQFCRPHGFQFIKALGFIRGLILEAARACRPTFSNTHRPDSER
jgi:hypothetical protein